MRIGIWHFHPRLWPSLAVLMLLPILLGLGFWQVQRAHVKEELEQAFLQRAAAAPLALEQALQRPHAQRYQRVLARGIYDPTQHILLDNQTYRGEAGYRVFSILRRANAKPALLVDRGWVSQGGRRHRPPPLPLPPASIVVRGMLDAPPAAGLRLGPAAAEIYGQVRVVQAIDVDGLERLLGYPLLPWIVRLDAGEPYGFMRADTVRPVRMGSARHRGYAFQWFALAAALIVIYIAVNTHKTPRPTGLPRA